jgi:hypothetical protein
MTRFHSAVLLILLAFAGACGGDEEAPPDANLTPDARPPRGTVSLSWTITQGGDPATCADVGASQVTLSLVPQGAGAGSPESFNCAAGEGTSIEIAVGTYDVDIDLVNATLESLLAAPLQQNGVEVTENNDTPLEPVVFEL